MVVKDAARRRPTIDDVATAAGVSRGTVSRVLNGGHWVSPDALAAVTAAIDRTGYRVNVHARSLATARTRTVAFLLTEPQHLLFEDPNFSALLRGSADALAALDLSLVLIMASSDDEQRRALDFLRAGHVDGVLLVSAHLGGRRFVRSVVETGLPAVASGAPLGFEHRMSYVAADDREAARTMVTHLRQRGARRIATVAGPLDTPGGLLRLEGYRQETGAGDELVAVGDWGMASGEAAMTELLASVPDLDGVFAANDRMALGAVRVLRAAGRRVPEDVRVGGFDDSAAATTEAPHITTMRQPFRRISEEMVRLLLGRIEGDGFASVTIGTELIERESSRAPGEHAGSSVV